MLRLRQLTIRKYRDCEPCELKFGPGQVFLLGMNGGGKTTLVELLSRLASLDLGFFENDTADIDLEWTTTIEVSGFPVTRATCQLIVTQREDPPELPALTIVPSSSPEKDWKLSAQVGALVPTNQAEPTDWGYEQWLVSGNSDGFISVRKLDPALSAERSKQTANVRLSNVIVSMFNLLAPDLPITDRGPAFASIAFAYHLVGPNIHRLDEAIVGFDRLVGQSSKKVILLKSRPDRLGAWAPVRVPLEVYRIALGEDAPVPISLQSFGGLFRQSRADQPSFALRAELALALGGTVEIVPILESEDADGSRTYASFTFYVTWPDGSKQRHDALSFGQKRMIAALWHIACTPERPVFTDELSNGLHAAWITRLLELLGDQQAFHATQNPLLLDLAGPGPADQVASRFVRCEVALVEGKRRWRWRNPTAEEAARINAGYEAGFQHLSDILQSEGLW